jgi:hypothetical protein
MDSAAVGRAPGMEAVSVPDHLQGVREPEAAGIRKGVSGPMCRRSGFQGIDAAAGEAVGMGVR